MDKYIFWFAARREVWAWLVGNKDEIEALWSKIHDLEAQLKKLNDSDV